MGTHLRGRTLSTSFMSSEANWDFSPSPIVSPTNGCSSCFLFSHFFFFLFFVRLDRPQWRWLTDAPCRCLLTCFALLPFSFPLRKSVDFRQLSYPSAPPAAMMTTAMITGFFVLSSGFGLSSGWHVHPPTWVTNSSIKKKITSKLILL